MSAILGFKGTKEELRNKLMSLYIQAPSWSNYCGRDGWPDIEGFIFEYMRSFRVALADEIVNQLYTQQEFEKDIGLTKEQ